MESRSILKSSIWTKPPIYFKVWHYLLLNAQYADYGNLKRGQLFTSIDMIREACTYYVGYRKEVPTRKQIFDVLEWLRNPCEGNNEGNSESTAKVPMIVTTKVTHGMIVTICKYNDYQNFKFYEGNNESNDEGTAKVTTKEQRKKSEGNNIIKTNKYKNINTENNYYYQEKEKEIYTFPDEERLRAFRRESNLPEEREVPIWL